PALAVHFFGSSLRSSTPGWPAVAFYPAPRFTPLEFPPEGSRPENGAGGWTGFLFSALQTISHNTLELSQITHKDAQIFFLGVMQVKTNLIIIIIGLKFKLINKVRKRERDEKSRDCCYCIGACGGGSHCRAGVFGRNGRK
ncbi:MAG: hypothetical protein WBK48_01065, partial [Dethiobacteria bacterium]